MRKINIRRTKVTEETVDISVALRARAEEHACLALEEEVDSLGVYNEKPVHLWRAKMFLELADMFDQLDTRRAGHSSKGRK